MRTRQQHENRTQDADLLQMATCSERDDTTFVHKREMTPSYDPQNRPDCSGDTASVTWSCGSTPSSSRGAQLTCLLAWQAAVLNQHVSPPSDHVIVIPNR
jgi:hypothetical protein